MNFQEGNKVHNTLANLMMKSLYIHVFIHQKIVRGYNLLLKFMSIESVMQPNHLILCIPFSSSLQSFPASGSFSNESVLHIRWPKYWSFSFSISPSNEYSGLISFRMDWLDLLAIQGTCPTPQESSPTPQFRSMNSSVLSSFYGSTLTSIHDYWKNNNFGYMDLCL